MTDIATKIVNKAETEMNTIKESPVVSKTPKLEYAAALALIALALLAIFFMIF